MTDGEKMIFMIGFGVGALVCGLAIVFLVNVDPLNIETVGEENDTVIRGIELSDWVKKSILDDQYKADRSNCQDARLWFSVHSEIYHETRPELEQSKEYRALASTLWHERMEQVC